MSAVQESRLLSAGRVSAEEEVAVGRSLRSDVAVCRILIVDDEETVAFALRDGLEMLPNCEILVADGGERALQILEERPFDLLLTDYHMPGMDGITLAARVRQLYPGTVVIIITAYGDDVLRKRAARASVRRVLDKPVELNEIRRAVLEALGRQEGARR